MLAVLVKTPPLTVIALLSATVTVPSAAKVSEEVPPAIPLKLPLKAIVPVPVTVVVLANTSLEKPTVSAAPPALTVARPVAAAPTWPETVLVPVNTKLPVAVVPVVIPPLRVMFLLSARVTVPSAPKLREEVPATVPVKLPLKAMVPAPVTVVVFAKTSLENVTVSAAPPALIVLIARAAVPTWPETVVVPMARRFP